jgi:hypothetical protein
MRKRGEIRLLNKRNSSETTRNPLEMMVMTLLRGDSSILYIDQGSSFYLNIMFKFIYKYN